MEKIEFDFYRNPKSSKDFQSSDYHIRINNRSIIDTDQMIQSIHEACSMTPSDVKGVLTALQDEIVRNLSQGNIVKLDGICQFETILGTDSKKCTGKEKGKDIVLKNIRTRPARSLEESVRDHLGKCVRASGNHSEDLSDKEVEKKLIGYFAKEKHLTRIKLEDLCGLTRYKATQQITRLIKEGKLENLGFSNHPIYVPVGNHFKKKI